MEITRIIKERIIILSSQRKELKEKLNDLENELQSAKKALDAIRKKGEKENDSHID